MTESIKIIFQKIDHQSPHLKTVINLGDSNVDTLSFFPRGAFISNAEKGNIFGAINSQGKCLGYILNSYRKSNDRVKLLHLCIDRDYRNQGIARKLVEHLKELSRNTKGIELTCRRDYELDRMWSAFGFVPETEKSAKTQGKINTVWRFDCHSQNLLSLLLDQQLESNFGAVLDPQIFFDLISENSESSQESKALLADWLQDSITLGLVNEIFNHIHSLDNPEKRKQYREFTANFTIFQFEEIKYLDFYQKLTIFFKDRNLEINKNQIRYIAQTLASDISFFVTHDCKILDLSNAFYQNFKISVKSPTDLIIQLTALREDQEYQPIRISGLTNLVQEKLTDETINKFPDSFWTQNKDKHETKSEFQKKIRRFLIEKDKFESIVIKNSSEFLVLIVYDRSNENELEIPMIRIGNFNKISLKTIIKHLVFQTISIATKENRKFTLITDTLISSIIIELIQRDCFLQVSDGWVKANLKISDTAKNIGNKIIESINMTNKDRQIFQQFGEILQSKNIVNQNKNIFLLEKVLYPVKIIDAEIPNFIIPIKPYWAANLFDKNLAQQTLQLFSKPEIVINREAVYYKSKKGSPNELKNCINGRILWYVTSSDKDRGYTETSSIRACSRLDEFIMGKPKELYKRFRNLGVYEEREVLDVTDQNEDTEIIAIQFSDNELFDHYIFHEELQELSLQNFNKNISVQSTSYISKELFAMIYHLGFNIK